MIAVTHSALNGTPVTGVTGAGTSMVYSVRLIDRRTGASHRINGLPLLIFTRNPGEASEDLLRNRDITTWEVRIDPIIQTHTQSLQRA